MHTALALLAGTALTFVSFTLSGRFVHLAICLVAGVGIWLRFYQRPVTASAFLVAMAITMELLGTTRFGTAVALAVIAITVADIANHSIRFTDRFIRFVLSSVVVYCVGTLLRYPLDTAADRLPTLAAAAAATVVLGYIATTLLERRHPKHVVDFTL